MATKALPPREYVLEALNYDPLTGLFTWRERPLHHFSTEYYQKRFNMKYAGIHAGSLNFRGYIRISINDVEFTAHRLAWLIEYGEPVPPKMDHWDRNRTNNKIMNLRAATHTQNQRNTGPQKNNTLGVKGVVFTHGKFQARITANGRLFYLGRFKSLEMATKAYQDAAAELHGEFARWSN